MDWKGEGMATTRGIMKQELKRSIGNIEWAIEHIARVALIYKDEHPEIALPLIEVCENLETVIEVIKQVDEGM